MLLENLSNRCTELILSCAAILLYVELVCNKLQFWARTSVKDRWDLTLMPYIEKSRWVILLDASIHDLW